MKFRSQLALSLFASSLVFAAGCAGKETARPAESITQTTASAPPVRAGVTEQRGVVVSDEIARACGLRFNNPDRSPKFDFDQSALTQEDREALAQVAACVTTGPLKGRALKLVGRADPRGEAEYNMALGEHRAGSAKQYLGQLGVDKGKMLETSRGKLDASGSGEDSWRRDRRVDILLQ